MPISGDTSLICSTLKSLKVVSNRSESKPFDTRTNREANLPLPMTHEHLKNKCCNASMISSPQVIQDLFYFLIIENCWSLLVDGLASRGQDKNCLLLNPYSLVDLPQDVTVQPQFVNDGVVNYLRPLPKSHLNQASHCTYLSLNFSKKNLNDSIIFILNQDTST